MKHRPVSTGADGWTRWKTPRDNAWRMSCCDCGLVHDLEFRIMNGIIEFRAKRNERATSAIRRYDRARRKAE